MSNYNNNILYFASCIIIILLFLLAVQVKHDKKYKKINSNIIVEINNKIIKIDNCNLATELLNCKSKLEKYKKNVYLLDDNTDICLHIYKSKKNLMQFIKSNNNMDLQRLESKTELLHKNLLDVQDDKPTNYKSISDLSDSENVEEIQDDNLHKKTKLYIEEQLIQLIYILITVINIIKTNVCIKGKINLDVLYLILFYITPVKNMSKDDYIYDEKNKLTSYVAKEQPFITSSTYIEPFKDINTHEKRESFENTPGFNKIIFKTANTENSQLTQNIENNPLTTQNISLGLEKLFKYNTNENDSSKNIYNSFEGTIARDALGYKPPGHIISKLHNPSEYYTSRVRSCGGKTVPDSKLWQECAVYDVKLLNAINGDYTGLMSDVPQ